MESKEKLQMLIDSVLELIDKFDDCGSLIGESTLHQDRMLRARSHLLVTLSILLIENNVFYNDLEL